MSSSENCRKTTAPSKTTNRQVMSSIHPGRPCHPCSLCGQGNLSKYFHPKSWKNSNLVSKLQEAEPEADIQPDSCICRPCRDDINKISNADFIPRWRRINTPKSKCCYPGCKNVSCKTTKLASRNKVFELLNVQSQQEEPTESDEQTAALCTEHYMMFYRILNPRKYRNCGVCKKSLTDFSKCRRCPDTELIQSYLAKNTDFSGQIGNEDYMCNACYRSQLIILKHLNNTTSSTDADLIQTMDKIKSETSDLTDISTLEQAILYASQISAVQVGETLLKQNAILLPDVYETFQERFREVTKLRRINIDQNLDLVASPNWLRSQLSSLLEHHMAYQCPVKKNGTVLYRYGGDLMRALSCSLSVARRNKPHSKLNEPDNFQSSMSDVCLTLNSKIHACAEKMIKNDSDSPHKIEEIEINQIISEIDQDLWKAICLLTQSRSTKKDEVTTNTRKIRQFFLHLYFAFCS